ncbi:hypothetical protein C8R46DRAFT_1027523 [Mycena filopes]|nr:hypothetical protein C8R46DRAFT_1027523 [Mycena filopes]
MFQPFENASQFFPGLILWCDPNSYDMEVSTLPPNTPYDRKKARELRPCLVVAVNQTMHMVQVARLCATTPTDPRRWVRIDTAPTITWKLPDAWIWVGTPATVNMVLNNHKAMHPHKDTYFTTPPVSTTNLQHYWTHRQNYLANRSGASSYPPSPSTYMPNTQPYHHSPGSTIYSSPNTQYQSTSINSNSNQFDPASAYAASTQYAPSAMNMNMNNMNFMNMNTHQQQQGAFTTLAPQPVVLPAGFTETSAAAPGWFRNPHTGWFWHAARGLVPPAVGGGAPGV